MTVTKTSSDLECCSIVPGVKTLTVAENHIV